MNVNEIKNIIKQEWNIQGFIATPLYIVTCGDSGITMKKDLGVGYEVFLYHFKKDYVEMYYPVRKIKSMWYEFEKRYKKDDKYFENIRSKYQSYMKKHQGFLAKIQNISIEDLSEDEFFKMFQQLLEDQRESVGSAHIIEVFSMLHDSKLRHILKDIGVPKGDLNRFAQLLSQPVTSSWLNANEKELARIAGISDKTEQQKQLEVHASKYYWVQNNYLHARLLTADDFRQQLESAEDVKSLNYDIIRVEKEELMKKLKLDETTRNIINLVEFFADFQDERKKYILKTLTFIEQFAYELARRYKIDKDLVKYFVAREITKEFVTQKGINDVLKLRRENCLVISIKDQNIILSGDEFKEIEDKLSEQQNGEVAEIHGLAASGGTAIGPVIICKTVDSIKNVQKGDVVFAPMTRPEYVSAMKKAAAIVTDEGGITCHAAIVSRELGIPCVIGTKNGTKVVKDGYIVEVKGNHGLVTIIDKGEKDERHNEHNHS